MRCGALSEACDETSGRAAAAGDVASASREKETAVAMLPAIKNSRREKRWAISILTYVTNLGECAMGVSPALIVKLPDPCQGRAGNVLVIMLLSHGPSVNSR